MEKIQSIRGIAKASRNDIRIMWLTDELMSSHQTIKAFMDKYLVDGIDDIFYKLTKYLITKELYYNEYYLNYIGKEMHRIKQEFNKKSSIDFKKTNLDNKGYV